MDNPFVIIGGVLLVAFLIVFGIYKAEQSEFNQMASKYSATYDMGDVSVFLDAIDCSWSDFDKSVTLRRTYEEVRDGKQSLAEIKKKKNHTTYIPMVIPVSSGR